MPQGITGSNPVPSASWEMSMMAKIAKALGVSNIEKVAKALNLKLSDFFSDF
ncbi:hypothetical protein GW888_01455 [Candidatus Wolfebacteria bacterium]|nr:hypothetical protein [Candidatus Wolfebacteria bacterium]